MSIYLGQNEIKVDMLDNEIGIEKLNSNSLESIDLIKLNNIKPYMCKDNLKLDNITLNCETIGKYAFYGCTNLTNVTLKNGLTDIGDYTFYNCQKLLEIITPNSLLNIGEHAFDSCSKLESITLNEGLIQVSANTFTQCLSLTNISLPNSLTTINQYAFSYCKALSSITIPENVTTFGACVFLYSTNLTEVIFNIPTNATLTIASNSFNVQSNKALKIYTDNQSIVNATWTNSNGVTFYHLDGTVWETAEEA